MNTPSAPHSPRHPFRFFTELPARLRTFLRALTHPGRFTREIDDEIAFHLESRTQDLIRSGLLPREASRQARIEFGAQPTHTQAMRRAFGTEWLASVAADLAYAWRLLRRSPGFTAITVISLALAIGANSAIFSTANELLFARLDVPHAKQLRTLGWLALHDSPIHMFWGSFGSDDTPGYQSNAIFPYPSYRQLVAAVPAVFAYKAQPNVTVTIGGAARVANTEMVSGGFFRGLEVTPALGRPIQDSDDNVQNGAPLVTLLSYGFWQRQFGGSQHILGATIDIEGTPATIIGVTPRGFTGASSVQVAPDLFVPLTAVSLLVPSLANVHPISSPELAWVSLMLRVQPDMKTAQVTDRLSLAMQNAVRSTLKVTKGESLPTVRLLDGSRGINMSSLFYAQPLYVLLSLAALVLLLACVNVANLMLARGSVREREMSVRMALGAARRRLFRQLLTECLLLCALGGVLGLLLAFAVRNLVPSLLWNAREQGGSLHIPFNWTVFAFTGAITLLAAVVSGLAPAWRATGSQPAAALKQAGSPSTRRRAWGGKLLVGAQVALSTLLVAGSLMFLRTVTNIERIRPGFDPHQLLLFSLDLPQHRYSPLNAIATHQRILAALRALPGVESASLTDNPLLAEMSSNRAISLEHSLKGAKDSSNTLSDTADVGSTYLDTMRIQLIAGRTFNSSDSATAPDVAVVSQAFARKFFGRYNPIGMRFSDDGKASWITVIGVCRDFRYSSLREPPPPVFFSLYTQQKTMEQATYTIRSSMQPAALVPSLRHAVAGVDRNLPLADIHTQEEQIRQLTQQERLFAALSTGFGILALALACAGVYGVFSYAVAGRTREIGIRLALGAQRGRVRAAILREALTLSVIALAAGLGATLALTRLVHSLLYGVSATDPLSLGATALLLLAVAILAAWLPAARASRVDPMHALRHE